MMEPSAYIGPLGVIVGAVIAVLGYRRATRIDEAVESAAVSTAQTGAIGQVIAGLNLIIDSLKDDNSGWREIVKEMRGTVGEMSLKLADVMAERDRLREDLNNCMELARRARSDKP